jgi:hypothetical protein
LPSPKAGKALHQVDCPMKGAGSLEGVLSYLTQKHHSWFAKDNIHDKGIVPIASKSVYGDDPVNALKNLADLTSDANFVSKDEPGQWVCWDFREMRIRPTQYTVEAKYLKSWVLEGSLDGVSWTEMNRQAFNWDFENRWNRASFTVSAPMECRFVRLTQINQNHRAHLDLVLRAVEFFGALFE